MKYDPFYHGKKQKEPLIDWRLAAYASLLSVLAEIYVHVYH